MHPKDEDIYPLETKVRWRKNGKIAVIKKHTFVMDGKNFLHYLGTINGDGPYCMLHGDLDVVSSYHLNLNPKTNGLSQDKTNDQTT